MNTLKQITYAMYMNNEFKFYTEEDKNECFIYWDNNIELFTDNIGRVFDNNNVYVADIII